MFSGTFVLQNQAAANGNGTAIPSDQFPAGSIAEIVESAGGTCTVAFQGSFDGTNWYAIGYQKIDATASPARAVTAISVSASTGAVYQLLDSYPQVRAVIASVAGGAVVTVKVFASA
jgi:hypothetical protein